DPTRTNPALWRRKIRWYGFPRDENGDGIVQGFRNGLSNNDLLDVVPVRDVVRTCIYGNFVNFAGFAWEHFNPIGSPTIPLNTISATGTGDYANVSTGIAPNKSSSPNTAP